MRDPTGITMTNSAKWAYYAPGNLGSRVVYGSMRDCVEIGQGRPGRPDVTADRSRRSPWSRAGCPGRSCRWPSRSASGAGWMPTTGVIIEPRHPDAGRCVAGHILAMPAARGSSSSSSILAELLRLGVGPSAIVLGEPDEILVVGSIAAAELYGARCPVVLLDPSAYAMRRATLTADRARRGITARDRTPFGVRFVSFGLGPQHERRAP